MSARAILIACAVLCFSLAGMNTGFYIASHEPISIAAIVVCGLCGLIHTVLAVSE